MRKKQTWVVGLIPALLVAVACGSVKTDSEVMAGLKAIATGCDIDVKYGWSKNCKAGEKDKFLELMKKKLSTDEGRVKALGTLATALHSSDEKLQAVAADRLYDNFRDFSHFGNNPKLISAALADKLISGTASVKSYVAFYAARSTTHAAMLAGKTSELYKMLEAHPVEGVRYEAYQNLMQYGRLKALPKVKELVAGSDERAQNAASYAPRSMYKYTEAEQKEVCEWSKGLLQHKNDKVAQNAASVLGIRCSGSYIDDMLNEAERRAKAGELKPPFSYALTSATFSCKSFLGSKPQGTPDRKSVV